MRAAVSLSSLVAACAFAALCGCSTTQSLGSMRVLESKAGPKDAGTFFGLPLRTGQIVLSESQGPYALLFSLGPARYFPFTHAAILVMEDAEPFVYDFVGAYKPGFEDRPTDAIRGGIRRLPFFEYCAPNLYVEVLDPPAEVDPSQLVAYIRAIEARDVPFDAYFRWDEHEALFCTEFVEMALRAAGAKPKSLVPVRQNPSLGRLLDWFRVPKDRALPAGLYLDPARFQGALGQFVTRTAAYSYFAAKRELHRRFTDDQVLGNIFSQKGVADLDLRPQIIAFMNRAIHAYDGSRFAPTLAEIDIRVRGIAAEMYGPFPEPR